jgi:uncharacterized protein (TIGR03083 family)
VRELQVAQIRPISRRGDAADVALAAYRQLDDVLRTLSARDWAAPTNCPGWTVSDMVGHLIGAANGNASVLEYTRQQLWGLRHRRDYGGNPLDATNALQIDAQVGVPDAGRADALAGIAPKAVRGRMRLSAALGWLRVPISTAGSSAGMPRTVNLGRLFDVVYTRDVWMHTLDIAEATGREPDVTNAVNQRIVEDVVAEWVGRHGQPVDLVLTGPCGGRFHSGPPGGDSLELDALDFCRTLSGRGDAAGLLATTVLF